MNPILKLNEFFVEGGDQKQSHVLLHVTEPTTPEEKKKGYFFAICEIGGAEPKQLIKLQNLVEEIENRYYEMPDTEEKTALEVVLEKSNHEAFSLIRPDIFLGCVIGAIRPPELIFSFYGPAQIFLFYKNKSGEYKKMDLTQGEKEKEPDSHLFSQIVRGKISSGDFVFAGTPHIINYFDHDRLFKVITTREPKQSADQLEKALSGLKNGYSFGGLILNMAEIIETPISKFKPTIQRQIQPNPLFLAEQKTADTLSPSMIQKTGKKIKEIFSSKQQITPEKYPSSMENSYYKNAQISSGHMRQHQSQQKIPNQFKTDRTTNALKITWEIIKLVAQGLIWFLFLVWTGINYVLKSLALLFFVITNYQNRRRNILNSWSAEWRNYKEFFKHLPTTTKILLLASLIITTILFTSGLYVYMRQQESARTEEYAKIIESIKIKKDNAESALIYNNEDVARQNLEEAKNLLATLPCKSEEEKIYCEKTSAQLDGLFTKMRRITLIKPTLLADWSGAGPQESAERIFKINKKIVGYGSKSPTIFVYDLLTKESIILQNQFTAQGFNASAVPKENDFAALLYGKNELASFDPIDNSIKKMEVSYSVQNADIKGIVIYSRRLYSLDVANNQIYRHDSTRGGFGQGKDWLKEKVNLSGGADLTIEGDIFALKKTGQILRFTAGKATPFAYDNIDPPLSNADQIWSYNDLKYVYVLDSQMKRLLLLEKTGKLKAQIMSSVFKNPTGMIIDEESKTGYIVDGNKLYQITLP